MAAEGAISPLGEPCPQCGVPLASDQRYCLNCGARRAYLSSLLAEGLRPALRTDTGLSVGASGASIQHPSRSGATTLIAGVGVLLLAMGVGVLIGRSSAPAVKAPAAQVISVSSPAAGGSGGESQSSAAPFTSDWSAGGSGYTVQLQTLPESATAPSSVASAKSAASANGATAVGALQSSEYSSLTGGNYVIYSGVYKTKGEADKALSAIKKKFPAASVIEVSNSGSNSTTESGSKSSSGVGNTPSKPAPASTLKSLKSNSGGNYEQKSKSLPNVVETG